MLHFRELHIHSHAWDLDGDSITDEGFVPVEGWNRDYVYVAPENATCQSIGHNGYFKCSYCSYDQHLDQVWIDACAIPMLPHEDNNEDGKCDSCKLKLYDSDADQPGDENKNCDCICHKENGFMKFIYKILKFFWKLFGSNKSCACGTVHY